MLETALLFQILSYKVLKKYDSLVLFIMALRKRESKLFDRIKKNIKNVHFTRIESSTVNGIPDVHGCGNGKSFWIELKSNTDKKPKLDKFQISWIYEYHRHGGKVFIMYQTLLQGAIETYRVKGITCINTIPELDLELVHSTPDPVPVSRWLEIQKVLLS